MSITITWLGHSTVVIDIDGVRLVADPLLRRHAGLLRRRGPRPAADTWRGADAVLLTHLHHDHAEVASLRLLRNQPVLTAVANAAWLRRKGLVGRGLPPGEWLAVGKGTAVGRGTAVAVTLVPAVHRSRPMPHRPNAANGHLVRGPSGVVWLAGDTELYPTMTGLAEVAGASIDLAVVPVGGWGPRLSGGHMGPEEAAVACRLSGARWAVPVHWKTLHVPAGQWFPRGWMEAAGPRFADALAREAPACRPAVLDLGESFTVPPRPPGPKP